MESMMLSQESWLLPAVAEMSFMVSETVWGLPPDTVMLARSVISSLVPSANSKKTCIAPEAGTQGEWTVQSTGRVSSGWRESRRPNSCVKCGRRSPCKPGKQPETGQFHVFKPEILDPNIPRSDCPPSLYQSTHVTKMLQARSSPRTKKIAQNKPAQKPAPKRWQSDYKLLRHKTPNPQPAH